MYGEEPKKILVAFPPAFLGQIDYVAQAEHRTRSDLVREALRRYLETWKRTQDCPVIPELGVRTK